MTNANAEKPSPNDMQKDASPVNSPEATPPVVDDDPLLHLHRMSMTAGLGSGDYVAVNLTAVIASLVGLASVLSFINPLLLLIPLTGLILSLVALRQIGNSNGTQTGRPLAMAGMVLSLTITVANFGWQGLDYLRRRDDSKSIAAISSELSQTMRDRDFDKAYTLFDDDFKQRVPLDAFKVHLAVIQDGKMSPPIDLIDWNGLAQFQQSDAGKEIAVAEFKLHFKGYEEQERMEVWLHKIDGVWQIDSMPDLFPAPKTAQGSTNQPK